MKNESFTLKEEKAHAISHGIGFLFGIFTLILLTTLSFSSGDPSRGIARDGWKIVGSIVYGVSMSLLYLSSTVYHGIRKSKLKDFFEFLDHSAVYILIAGTYTPFLLVTLRGSLGWFFLCVVWGLALLGIFFKFFFVKKFALLSTILYILMGWLIVFAMGPLISKLPLNGVLLLLAGGISYTIGTFFYLYRKFRYHHFVWHLFVLAGSVLHFFSILFYVILP